MGKNKANEAKKNRTGLTHVCDYLREKMFGWWVTSPSS